MIINASKGCYLTEVADLAISQRQFLTSVDVADFAEAALWKEVTETEKERMILHGELMEVGEIDMNYLYKVDAMLEGIAKGINDAALTDEEALQMKKYYPAYESLIGQQKFAGFKFLYDFRLLEVKSNHTFSEEVLPISEGVINEAFHEVGAPEPEPIPSEPSAEEPQTQEQIVEPKTI